METSVRWKALPAPSHFRFECLNNANLSIETDARSNDAYEKVALSPKELVAAGHAACSGIDVVSLLKKMRQPLQELEIRSEITQTKEDPAVFQTCEMTYLVNGEGLDPDRVAHAVELSFVKYCGVNAMLLRSGCQIIPKLVINGLAVNIFDCDERHSKTLRQWYLETGSHCEKGIAVVVGASRGIGHALCKELAAQNFGVIPLSRNPCTFDDSRCAPFCRVDLTNRNLIQACVEQIRGAQIPVSLLVLNAGVIDQDGQAPSQSINEWRRVYDTNFFGTIELVFQAMPLLADRGTIAFLSSRMGLISEPSASYPAYRSSKNALTHFTHELAIEIREKGQDIAVVSLHPGSVETKLNPNGKLSPEESARRIVTFLEPAQRAQLLAINGSFWSTADEVPIRLL